MDISTLTIILGGLAAVSEAIALIPGMKSNSIFQLVFFIIKAIVAGIQEKEV